MHLIQLWPGDWARQMEKIKEAVCMKNHLAKNWGGTRLVRPFKRQEIWKCIVFILSAVTYVRTGHKLWIKVPKCFGRYENPKLRRDVCGNAVIYMVSSKYVRN